MKVERSVGIREGVFFTFLFYCLYLISYGPALLFSQDVPVPVVGPSVADVSGAASLSEKKICKSKHKFKKDIWNFKNKRKKKFVQTDDRLREHKDPVSMLSEKKKDREKKEKDRAKRLHELATGYSRECHNNGKDFEYNFCQDASPVVNLLKTAYCKGLRIDSLYCSMRILFNAFKSCEYIRDCSLNSMLEALDLYATSYFEPENEDHKYRNAYRAIERTVYDFVSDGGDLALSSPGTFASSLSLKVLRLSSAHLRPSQLKQWQERLGSIVLRFLEVAVGKVFWDANDYPCIWDSVMTSANGLYQLSKILVHMDDLDDLLWSLVRRFVWFLDFSSGQIPVSFYENIEQEIQDGAAFFLELGEQDEGIVSKKSVLLDALRKAKERALNSELFSQDDLTLQARKNIHLGSKQPVFAKSKTKESSVPRIESLVEPLESLFENPVKRRSIVAKGSVKKDSFRKVEV